MSLLDLLIYRTYFKRFLFEFKPVNIDTIPSLHKIFWFQVKKEEASCFVPQCFNCGPYLSTNTKGTYKLYRFASYSFSFRIVLLPCWCSPSCHAFKLSIRGVQKNQIQKSYCGRNIIIPSVNNSNKCEFTASVSYSRSKPDIKCIVPPLPRVKNSIPVLVFIRADYNETYNVTQEWFSIKAEFKKAFFT